MRRAQAVRVGTAGTAALAVVQAHPPFPETTQGIPVLLGLEVVEAVVAQGMARLIQRDSAAAAAA